MLNKFYLLGLVIVCTSAKAQNISGSYQPTADGQVKKQQVEYVPMAEISPNIVWDFSELELPEASYTVKYTEVAGQEGMTNKVEEYANALQNAIYSFIKRENK